MSLRRIVPLALVVLACQADIPNQAPPSTVVFAVTVPSATDATQVVGTRPLSPPFPNDLLLQSATCNATAQALTGCTLPVPASLAPLAPLATLGGFPDTGAALGLPLPPTTPLPIRIQLIEKATTGDPSCAPAANATPAFPDIDPASITAENFALVRYDTGTLTPVPFVVPPGTAGYDPATGVLTILPAQPWAHPAPLGGRYVAALRSGNHGIKTSAGQPVVLAAQTSAYLISQGKDLTKAENQGLLRSCLRDPVLTATAVQLERLRQVYSTSRFWTNVTAPVAVGWQPVDPAQLPAPLPIALPAAFDAIDAVFPHAEIATIQTFVVHP